MRNDSKRPRLWGTKAKVKDNLRVGRAQVKASSPSHVSGIHQGNAPWSVRKKSGFVARDGLFRGTARRSTSINPSQRNPIDPDAPNLSPP